MKYVVKIDIGSKQKYIFSSNILKEIIGASEIIRYVTENLGKEVLKNIKENPEIYTGNNKGNILFEAGGNAMYIFDTIDKARKFNEIFSKFVVKYFDGLELLMVIKEFDIENENIVNLYEKIEESLTRKKGSRKNQFRRIGYGLSKICEHTKKPAGYVYEDKYISKESNDKLNFYNFIYKKCEYYDEKKEIKYTIDEGEVKYEITRLYIKLIEDDFKLNDFKLTKDIDIIAGEKNEGSYIGITCIDGNSMGKKFNSFNDKYKNVKKGNKFESNVRYIKEFRNITKEVDDAYKETFKATIEILINNYENYCENINYKKENKILPIRPIILAGDDITFVSNGKIAVEVTKIFTENITKVKVQFGDNQYNLTTSAGTAIVKRTHPFSRAVKLAEALEKNSKKALREMKLVFEKEKLKGEKDASFIDWEINRGDTLDDISIIRNKNVVARPYIIIPEEKKMPKNVFNIYDSRQYESLKSIINYNFYNFCEILNAINKSEAKSSLKSFFRTMNSQEIDADLFYLKYKLKDKIKGDIDLNILKEVVYDAIDIMDLYTYVKGEK
ncbi:Cas10/Cmr2 second palm domain-containing protein [Clostridium frigidicarnis]|uniref:Cas10/Cmr2 second palm domain-containing protein n=1 Tax=Clostridium frigidicarnis TaxID=84698 RepID=A0A1I0V639_9CLOT|nr:hypothetical protein [Clostridium frigidicarnis]SFA71834.1 hypothetical protein SAMN04488528_1001185 [Clostridium frigidicarnis]